MHDLPESTGEYVKEDMGRGAELMKSILKAREYREAITKNKK